jgi:hypothetical protein
MQVGEYLLDDHRVLNAGDHITLTAPPYARHVSMSILKTRLNRLAQFIEARCSAGVGSVGSLGALTLLPLPRFAGVPCTRGVLFGVNTP